MFARAGMCVCVCVCVWEREFVLVRVRVSVQYYNSRRDHFGPRELYT